MTRLDLHTHTTASDGDLAPAELVAHAHGAGVSVLAVTDHDTLEGLDEAVAAGVRLGVRVVPGVEVTAATGLGRSLHLLGYLPHTDVPELAERLREAREHRVGRARHIMERLERLGVPVDAEVVAGHAGGNVGRPHIARALVEAGHCADTAEAFRRFLGDGGPADVPHRGPDGRAVVRLLRAAGGVPVLAHPWSLRLGHRGLHAYAASLRHAGLVGIEVHRPEVSPDQHAAYAAIARRLGLIPSGGSDFHGPGAGVTLGDTGDPPLPCDTVERLFGAVGRGVPWPDDHR